MRFKIGADVAFVSLFIMLLVCIVIPMPGWLLDFLISMNICITILILIISLNISSAVELPSFPSILLVTTLFRLSLNVASTRAILTTGDPGRVISAFGNFVIAGNYFAGAVVFLIITIIQLVVVTKGAERVAEVSARFTLDAMPGKQMSIDAELRAGHISQDEALKRRANLSIESQFFGSMDGAMKFVKGDAIAGILISLINVVGGIMTGTILKNLNLSEAVSRYTILSIGDGLVSQIPSLIISVSSGIIITRISTIKKAGLGKEIFISLTRNPLMIFISAIVAFLFSLLPKIPFLPFFFIGVLLVVAYKKLNSVPSEGIEKSLSARDNKTEENESSALIKNRESISPFADPLTIMVSEGLCADDSICSPDYIIKEILPEVRKRFVQRLGFRLPGVRLVVSDVREPSLTMNIYGAEIANLTFKRDALFLIDKNVSGDKLIELYNGLCVRYYTEGVDDKNIECQTLSQILTDVLYTFIQRNIRDLFGIQEASEIVEDLSLRYPALIKETIPRTIGINVLSEVLKNLLSEQVPIKNMKCILETIEKYAPYEKNPNMLTEFVRVSLARYICQDLACNKSIPVYVLSQSINKIIYDSIADIGGEQVLSISPENARKVIESVRHVKNSIQGRLIIITEFETRRFIRKIIEYEMPSVVVISFKEISPEIKVEPCGMIGQ